MSWVVLNIVLTISLDFGFSNSDDEQQGARFATLLLYLNEGMTGGETSFPRWVNAETFRELKVAPTVGKAVLFYSQLPGKCLILWWCKLIRLYSSLTCTTKTYTFVVSCGVAIVQTATWTISATMQLNL